jgi:hypothetical protein
MDRLRWLESGGVAGFTVALVAAAIALAAALFARRANHVSSSAYVSSLVGEWRALEGDWVMSLLLARGVDDYYVPATTEQRERAREVLAKSRELTAPEDLTDKINVLRSVAPSLRRVARFLARCSELLVLGRLRPGEIYLVLGPDVARLGSAVRWIAGTEPEGEAVAASWNWSSRDGIDRTVREEVFHGEQDLVLTLVDLLWAEAARRGDHNPASFVRVASHKRIRGTDRVCRSRLRRLVFDRGCHPIVALRLRAALRSGAYIPVRTLRRVEYQLMRGDEQLARRPGWPRPLDRWIGRLAFSGRGAIPPVGC